MNEILREYIGKFCQVYMDDIVIYSDSVEEHKKHISLILQTLRNHDVVASRDKAKLFADRIEFLGHIISSRGIQPTPDKLEKISAFPRPRSVGDIKLFLGLVNYLAQFDYIPGLADHSSILTNLTRKDIPFRWTEEHENAFKTVKKLASTAQLLQRIDYDSGDPIWRVADASNRGVGGYVAQGKDWKTARPIGFYSRQYRSAETNYPTHEQELLAIISCMKHWLPQLTGTRFEVLTDHAPLRHWKTQKDLSKRQIRWLNFLCDFDFDIHYIPGITNTAADALSRYPYAQSASANIDINAVSSVHIDPEFIERLTKAYEEDKFFNPIIENPEQYPRFQISDSGLVYVDDGRLCIPRCKVTREALLYHHHDNENHFGIRKTRESLTREYFWPGITKESLSTAILVTYASTARQAINPLQVSSIPCQSQWTVSPISAWISSGRYPYPADSTHSSLSPTGLRITSRLNPPSRQRQQRILHHWYTRHGAGNLDYHGELCQTETRSLRVSFGSNCFAFWESRH